MCLLPSPASERMRRFRRKGLTMFTICTQNGTLLHPESHVLLILIHGVPLCLCFWCLHCCLCRSGFSMGCLLILLKLMPILQLFNQLLELWTSYNLRLAIKQPAPCLVLCMLGFLMQLVFGLVECHCCQSKLDML